MDRLGSVKVGNDDRWKFTMQRNKEKIGTIIWIQSSFLRIKHQEKEVKTILSKQKQLFIENSRLKTH